MACARGVRFAAPAGTPLGVAAGRTVGTARRTAATPPRTNPRTCPRAPARLAPPPSPLLLVARDGESHAALGPAAVDDGSAGLGLHAGPEAVRSQASGSVRLIGALHGNPPDRGKSSKVRSRRTDPHAFRRSSWTKRDPARGGSGRAGSKHSTHGAVKATRCAACDPLLERPRSSWSRPARRRGRRRRDHPGPADERGAGTRWRRGREPERERQNARRERAHRTDSGPSKPASRKLNQPSRPMMT